MLRADAQCSLLVRGADGLAQLAPTPLTRSPTAPPDGTSTYLGGRRMLSPIDHSVQPRPLAARAHVDPCLQGAERPIGQADRLVMSLSSAVSSGDMIGSGENGHERDPSWGDLSNGRPCSLFHGMRVNTTVNIQYLPILRPTLTTRLPVATSRVDVGLILQMTAAGLPNRSAMASGEGP